MKDELLNLICCPACRHALEVATQERCEPEIWGGHLTCTQCRATYPIQKGMPLLYVNDEKWQPKSVEAQGWVTYHKNLGIYEVRENAIDLQIPYYPEEPWTGVARSFDVALERLHLSGQETILDLGAGRGWAAKQFALRGCRVVALDVVADENVGLGRARALLDHAGTYFDRIISDGENLPFLEGQFDIVFCAAALHHSANLPLLLQNISRVLKPGGRLCAINEPCRTVLDNEQNLLKRHASDELAVGIIETRPDLPAYQQAVEQAGLRPTAVFPALAYNMDDATLQAWAGVLGAIRPHFRQRPLKHQAVGWLRYLARRTRALAKGITMPVNSSANRREQIATAVLLWAGGELFLLAEKQP